MKKTLLTLALASACAVSVSAGKVAIVVENEPYDGDADEIRIIHVGDQDMVIRSNAFVWEWHTLSGSNITSQVNCSVHWYAATEATLTPAPGVTITKIEAVSQISMGSNGAGPAAYTWSIPFNDEFSADKEIITWTGSLSAGKSMKMQPEAQSRFTVIEVTYTGTPELPKMPVADPESTVIPANESIVLNGEAGSSIYYTLDGSEPTTSSTLYTGPISLNPGTYELNAMAVKDGKQSYVLTENYLIVDAGLEVVKYNFRSLDDLTMPNKEWPATAASSSYPINISENEFEQDGVTFQAYLTTGKNYPRMAKSTNGGFIEMRVYTGNEMLVMAPFENYIGAILFAGTTLSGVEADELPAGTFEKGGIKNSYALWRPNEGVRDNIVGFSVASGTNYIDNLYVCHAHKSNASVDAIEVDNSNAPVIYYNLQGMQMNEGTLTPGVYIKRQGQNAGKVYVR